MVPAIAFSTLCLLSAFTLSTTALSSDLVLNGMSSRHLKAASREGSLRRRDGNFMLHKAVDLVYAEDQNTHGSSSVFASTVRIHSDKSILVLEEFEDSITNVNCHDSGIDVTFASDSSCAAAISSWRSVGRASVVTSHKGCNLEDERAIFDLHGVEHPSAATIRLRTNRSTWRTSVSSLSFDFGHSSQQHELRRRSHLGRRDMTQTVTVTASVSEPANPATTVITTQVVTSIVSASREPSSSSSFALESHVWNNSIPSASAPLSPFPSETPLHFNLTFQKLDQNINLPILPPPAPQLNVSLGCKNCTTSGSLDLKGGMFIIEPGNIFGNGQIIKNGSVTLSMADGLQAHLELGANVSASGEFDVPLFDIPVQGFTIPGIGRAGLTFSTSLKAEFNMSEAMQLGFGFEVNVPQNSAVYLNLANFTNSSMTGFEKTNLTSLPFSINGSVTGTMSAALKPSIPIGFEFFDGEISADAAVFLEAPSLKLNLTKEVNATNPSCKPDEKNATTTLNQELRLGVGLEAGVMLNLNKIVPGQANGQWPALAALGNGASLLQSATATLFYNTTIPQPTHCFGAKEPTSTSSSSTSASSSSITPAPTSSSINPALIPITSALIKTGPNAAVTSVVVDICAALLVVVAMVFVLL